MDSISSDKNYQRLNEIDTHLVVMGSHAEQRRRGRRWYPSHQDLAAYCEASGNGKARAYTPKAKRGTAKSA